MKNSMILIFPTEFVCKVNQSKTNEFCVPRILQFFTMGDTVAPSSSIRIFFRPTGTADPYTCSLSRFTSLHLLKWHLIYVYHYYNVSPHFHKYFERMYSRKGIFHIKNKTNSLFMWKYIRVTVLVLPDQLRFTQNNSG